MREHTKHPYKICTHLVGRKINSSLLMYQCCIMLVVFHNILIFMTELKKSNDTTTICGNLFRRKGSPIFARKLDSCVRKMGSNICYGVNKWHAEYNLFAKFGRIWDTTEDKINEQCRIGDTCFISLATIGGNLYTRHPKLLIMYTNTLMIFCHQ